MAKPFQVLLCVLIGASSLLVQDKPAIRTADEINTVVSRIAFGSCGHQDHDQPVLNTVVSKKPDLFIYLGDNIYLPIIHLNLFNLPSIIDSHRQVTVDENRVSSVRCACVSSEEFFSS